MFQLVTSIYFNSVSIVAFLAFDYLSLNLLKKIFRFPFLQNKISFTLHLNVGYPGEKLHLDLKENKC